MSASSALGRQFGQRVKEALNHPELSRITDAHPDLEGMTPQSGSCRACAVGLHQALPGSAIHGVFSDAGAEHFVVKHQGQFLDSHGSTNRASLQRHWGKAVGTPVSVRPASMDDIYGSESPDPVDTKTGRAASDDIGDYLARKLR